MKFNENCLSERIIIQLSVGTTSCELLLLKATFGQIDINQSDSGYIT